jgi:hypothetical protein
MRQFSSEVAAKTGQLELARRLILLAVEDGLADVYWLETCELLRDLREDGTLEEPIAVARDRARALRVALGYA